MRVARRSPPPADFASAPDPSGGALPPSLQLLKPKPATHHRCIGFKTQDKTQTRRDMREGRRAGAGGAKARGATLHTALCQPAVITRTADRPPVKKAKASTDTRPGSIAKEVAQAIRMHVRQHRHKAPQKTQSKQANRHAAARTNCEQHTKAMATRAMGG